jgi:hypothetical protein
MRQNQQQRDFPNARRCDTVLLQGPDVSEGRNSLGAVLPCEALVCALSALIQALCIPFDEKLVTGQMSLPRGQLDCPCGRPARTASGWAKRPASALQKLLAPFLVLLSPALREPHNGLVAGRESLASLDSAAPNQRLAFFLCIKANRVDFNGAGPASLQVALDENRIALHRASAAAPKEKALAEQRPLGVRVTEPGTRGDNVP